MLLPWQRVLRKGFFPQWERRHLLALERALEENDRDLEQGVTTTPPPLQCMQRSACEQACLIGFPFWEADGLETVGEVDTAFAEACNRADHLTGEYASSRHLTNWWDDTPREKARLAVLAEVRAELERRKTPTTIREHHDAETLSLPPE